MTMFTDPSRVHAVYYDENGIEHTQPISDITCAGTLIDPENGDDMGIDHLVIADHAVVSASKIRRNHRFSGLRLIIDHEPTGAEYLVVGTRDITLARNFLDTNLESWARDFLDPKFKSYADSVNPTVASAATVISTVDRQLASVTVSPMALAPGEKEVFAVGFTGIGFNLTESQGDPR